MAGKRLFGNLDRHGDPRFAIFSVAQQNRLIEIGIELRQLIGGKQRIEYLIVMLEDQLVAGKGQKMCAFHLQGIGHTGLVAIFGKAVKIVLRKGRQSGGFGMGRGGIENAI